MHKFWEWLFGGRTKPADAGAAPLQVALAGRQHAERSRQQSEEHFGQLVAGVRDYAVFLLDRHGHVLTWNTGAERIKGYRAEEIIGQHFSRFYPSDTVSSGWPAHELKVAAETGRFEDEGWRVRKDGSRFWANVVITALRGEGGEVRGFLKITRDLTDRKQAEEKLRLSEERFRLIVEGVKDYAIFMLDPQGRVATWNAGAERIKGYRAEEIIGQHFSRFYPPEVVARGWPEEELRRAAADGRIEDEGWRVRKDGSRFWANVVITALRDDAGTLRGFAKVTRDLTDRRRAEENARKLLQEEAARRAAEEAAREIERQREQLRVTLASIGDAVIVTDTRGAVTFLNRVAAGLTGWAPEDAAGQPLEQVFRIINERTRQPAEDPVGRVFRENAVVALANHTALVARDGREVPIEDTAAPIREEGGAVGGAVLVFRDVTQARRATEARLHLAAIVESSDDAIISKDLNGVITSWNRGAERLYGYTAAEVVGRPLTLLIPPDHPDEFTTLLARVRRGERIEHFETVRVRKDGRRVNVSLTISPVRDAEGTVVGASKIARDVTEQKRVEATLRRQNERLRLLWEAAAVLLHADDPDAMLHNLFAKVGPHLGLDAYFNFMVTEAGDALRLSSYAGIPAEAAPALGRLEFGQAVSGTVARRRQPVVVTEVQHSDDPTVQPVKSFGFRCHACHPLLAGERLLGTLSFASRTRDRLDPDELEFLQTLSYYVTVAYERLRLIRQLTDADRRKDEFLATLAHELRNPLAPIRNGLQVLRLARGNAAAAEQAQGMMERQLGGLVRLVDDLLDVSRISRGKIELRKERIDLAAAVGTALETCDPHVRQHGHELSVSLPAEPVFLDADKVRLAQAVSNLLTNAAKYTPPGGRIAVTARREGGEAVVSVRDTGVGIPADMLPRVFDLFTQVDRTLERSQGGLGVGLTIVKRLVELHGGHVEARSEGPGRGSEFVIRLPAAPPAVPARPGAGGGPLAGPTSRRRVLVADDNADAAASLAMMLELMGHEVRTAHDGVGAVAAAAEYRPDLILLDIGMPRLSGHDACRHIRAQPWANGLVIVALTGWGQDEDRRRSQEAGFDHHLTKPVEFDALQQLLASVRPHRG